VGNKNPLKNFIKINEQQMVVNLGAKTVLKPINKVQMENKQERNG